MRISDWSSDVCSSDLVVTNLRPGDTVEVAGYSLLFEGVSERRGPNYAAERARFAVMQDGEEIARMFPEKRMYDVRAMPTTEAAIRTTFLADLYVVIGDADGQGGWTVRVYHEPLVPWIRSEEHTSDLQSLMRISYAVFCLNKKN